jgi:hypothetical protein
VTAHSRLLTAALALCLWGIGIAPSQAAPKDRPGHDATRLIRRTCLGLPATILGTRNSDHLHGTAGDDVIFTGTGDDRVHAGAGDDVVCGGGGSDSLYGHGGNDTIHDLVISDGMTHSGYLEGGLGDDHLVGRGPSISVYGNRGSDVIVGEMLFGARGADTLRVPSGRYVDSSHLAPGLGNDFVNASTGSDYLSYKKCPRQIVAVNADERWPAAAKPRRRPKTSPPGIAPTAPATPRRVLSRHRRTPLQRRLRRHRQQPRHPLLRRRVGREQRIHPQA